MGFHERDYDVYALLVSLEASRPWLEPCWRRITEATSSVFFAARDRPAVRSTQLGGTAPRMRPISFGRIAHDERGAAKWTHEKDGQLLSGDQAYFLSSEVWAPSWNTCERDGKPPDIYLCISNEELGPALSGGVERLQFSSKCIFAVACDLGDHVRRDGRRTAQLLCALMSSPVSATCIRPWGRSTGGNSFTDAISDLSMIGLFKPGPRHATRPSLSMFKGSWTSLGNTPE